jgi:hypothetical protein
MEKQIRGFMAWLEGELAALESLSAGDERAARARALAALYRRKISDYKHERLVHLIVMLFFVAVTGLVFTAAMLLPQIAPAIGFEIGTTPVIGLYVFSVALIVIDIFYIKHYYFLENSVQKLYESEMRIFGLARANESATS